MSNIIKASQIRQEEKLRQIFAEQFMLENTKRVEKSDKDLAEDQLKQAQDEAAAIMAEAQRALLEAEQRVAQVEDEIRQAKEAGWQEGFNRGVQEGYETGINHLLQEMDKMFTNLEREMENARMILQNQVEGCAPRLINLSVQIAEKILRREVQSDPGIVINQVQTILRSLGRVKSLAIRVNPTEMEYVKAQEERFLELLQGIDGIEFVIDHSLEPGGCILETNSGGVDATIKTQLEMIEAILLEGNRDANA